MFAALLSSITFLNQAPADIDKELDLGGVREEHIPKENVKEFKCPAIVQILSPYTCTLDKGGAMYLQSPKYTLPIAYRAPLHSGS